MNKKTTATTNNDLLCSCFLKSLLKKKAISGKLVEIIATYVRNTKIQTKSGTANNNHGFKKPATKTAQITKLITNQGMRANFTTIVTLLGLLCPLNKDTIEKTALIIQIGRIKADRIKYAPINPDFKESKLASLGIKQSTYMGSCATYIIAV